MTWSDGVVSLRDERVFGPGEERLLERFLARVFRVEEVVSVSVDRQRCTATIHHGAAVGGRAGLLQKLVAVVRGDASAASSPTFVRVASLGGTTEYLRAPTMRECQAIVDRAGRLTLRVDALRGKPGLAQRVERQLEGVPGVRRVSASATWGRLAVCYDDALLSASRLRQFAEQALFGPDVWSRTLPEPPPISFKKSGTALGLAAVGQYAIPVLLPICAVLLVAMNLKTFRTASLQLRRRQCGLPVLYTAIVVTTLATGQFVSSALMSWFFEYWNRRCQRDLASERHRLLDSCMPLPGLVRLQGPGLTEILVAAEQLRAGNQVNVSAGESIPADGRVVEGEAIVDERSLRGLDGASRKRAGDAVLAGSIVLAGEVRMVVDRPVGQTRAESIGRALVASTSHPRRTSVPARNAEALADRAVGPTLAAAGVGFMFGVSVGAILRPDYATGPGLGVPLDTLRDVAYCTRRGLIVRDARVFERLNEVDTVVLDDGPLLRRAGLEVADVETQLAVADVLRLAASAFRHLDDPRSLALKDKCLKQRIHLLDLAPIDLGSGVTIQHGERRVWVHDHETETVVDGPLRVEINGATAGLISFREASAPPAAGVIRRLREQGVSRFVLLSERPAAEAAFLAAALGVNQLRSGLGPGEKAAFLRDCRERGGKAAFVGDCRRNPAAAAEAHVAVSLSGDGEHVGDAGPEAVLLLGERPDRLEILWDVARSHAARVRLDHAFVVAPNLFCVAGAFFFGFTALTAVLLSNLGTAGVYTRATGELRALEQTDRRRLGLSLHQPA